jgi:hypothetical protein
MNYVISLLNELQELLRRYDRVERADFIEALARSGESDELWQELRGLEFWGGSGAVWEIEPFQFSHPARETSESDYRRFQTLMVDLGSLLEVRGMASLSARTVALFRRQLEDGG